MARVLARYASGHSLKKIAEEEHLSLRSMKTLSREIRKRLGAGNLAQATLIAHELGYVSLPDEDGVVLAQSPFSDPS